MHGAAGTFAPALQWDKWDEWDEWDKWDKWDEWDDSGGGYCFGLRRYREHTL